VRQLTVAGTCRASFEDSLMTETRPRTSISITLLLALALPPIGTAAQAPAGTPQALDSGQKVAAAEDQTKPTRRFFPALFHNLGDDVKHIPRTNSLYWLAAGSGLALVAHQKDNSLLRRMDGANTAVDVFKVGKVVGSLPFLLGTSAVTYAVGRHKKSGRVQHLGMDLIEATLLSEGMTQIIKYSVRRERPIRDDGKRTPGFAFPSGHSAGTFAFATVLQQHLGWKWAVPTYSIASYVAISRLVDQRHYASDVAFGASEGIIVGRSVTWHGRNYYASPLLMPKGAGIMVSVTPRPQPSRPQNPSTDR
jgi:membrane-associated phospholipid phosphatase